jgi:hypothetical protein
VIRFFNIEALDIASYDDEQEEWRLNGELEGRMSSKLAGLLMGTMRREEVTLEDADSINTRRVSPRPTNVGKGK